MTPATGAVVIVTGADRGIGLEATRTLLASGCRVAALDLTTDALDGLAPAGDLLVCRCDVRREGDVESAVRSVVDRWGRVDALVNNAAVAPFARLEETSAESVGDVLDVNVLGYVRTIKAVLPVMKAQRRGSIVNVGSVLATVGLPSLPAYAASKGAVEGLTRSLALDLRRYGITVTLFHPPNTRTGATRPLGLPDVLTGDPVKVAIALARSVGTRRTLVTADLRTAAMVLFARLVPGLFGRVLARVVTLSQRAARRRGAGAGCP